MGLELHSTGPAGIGRWDTGFERWPVAVNVPKGLEGACAGIARREGLRLQPLSSGILRAVKGPPDRLAATMRDAPIWSFGSFVIVAMIEASDIAADGGLAKAVSALGAAVEHFGLAGTAYWLNCPKDESPAARRLAALILDAAALAIPNSPSDYRLTLRLVSDADRVHVLLGPSISVRERFLYRRLDVGASINPVLAAALARLAPPCDGGVALDPTCGSGTLLAERLAYSNEAQGIGIDLSSRAEVAFRANLGEAPAAGHFRFHLGSAADPAHWQGCRIVLANLPFGIRVRQPRAELEALYHGIIANAVTFLEPDGRIILTSSFKSLLDEAFDRAGKRLRILSRYRAEMGGLVYQIVVAAKA